MLKTVKKKKPTKKQGKRNRYKGPRGEKEVPAKKRRNKRKKSVQGSNKGTSQSLLRWIPGETAEEKKKPKRRSKKPLRNLKGGKNKNGVVGRSQTLPKRTIVAVPAAKSAVRVKEKGEAMIESKRLRLESKTVVPKKRDKVQHSGSEGKNLRGEEKVHQKKK